MENTKRQIKYYDEFSLEILKELLETKTSILGYVYNLKEYSEDIIEGLIKLGYKDNTDKQGRTNKTEFNYLICKDKKTLKIFIKIDTKHAVTLVDFCNIVSGNKIQLKDTYKKETVRECMQEAIENLQAFGMDDNSTIGSASLKIFRDSITYNFNFMFPHSIYEIETPKTFPYTKNVADLIRNSYNGGWCFLNPQYKNRTIDNGIVFDINSLYPFCMVNFNYPVGKPTSIWQGEEPEITKTLARYRFYIIRTRFKVKEGCFPFIKIKNDLRYKQNETPLKVDNSVVLTLCETDLELFKQCYDIDYLEYIGGCAFKMESGEYLFGDYIRKLYDIKQNADGVIKHTSKMLLNNLGGKFGSGMDSTHYVYKDGTLKIKYEWKRRGSYIPVASAMTAYARSIIINMAIKNKDRFIYSDTDSLHLIGSDIPEDVVIGNNIGEWKVENIFTHGYYKGQKVYSFNTGKDNKYYIGEDIKTSPVKFVVAGMTDTEKWEFIQNSHTPAKILV